jgi:hypothetical protein
LPPAKQEPLKKRVLIEAGNEHGNAEKVRPVPESGLGDFSNVKTGQLVTMLPHEDGMVWWNKCGKGTEYEQHRAEIIAAVLEYQKTQEAQQ